MATLKEIFEGNTADILEATELLKVLGDREGQYVWKKSKVGTVEVENPTFLISGSAGTGATVTSDVDLSLIDESFFDGFMNDAENRWFFYDENGLHYYNGTTNYDAVWDSASYTMKLLNNTASFSGATFHYTGNKTVYRRAEDGITVDVTSYNPCVLVVHSDCYDLSKVDESFFVGWTFYRTNSDATLTLYAGGTGETRSKDGKSTGTFTWTYDPVAQTITTTKAYTSDSAMTVEPVFQVIMVVADSEDTYPNYEVQDGYYYELFDPTKLIAENIREGVDIWGVIGTLVGGVPLPPNFTKFAVNEFTPSSRRQLITAYHDLGEEPKVMYMVANSDITKLSNSDVIYLAKVYGSGYASLSYRKSTATDGFDGGYTSWLNVDSEKIETVQGMDYYFAKVPYFILTMA